MNNSEDVNAIARNIMIKCFDLAMKGRAPITIAQQLNAYEKELIDALSTERSLRVEAEKRVSKLEKTVYLPEHMEVLQVAFQRDWKLNFEKLESQLSAERERFKELHQALADFGTHEQVCAAGQWRQGEPTPEGGYRTLYGYGKNEKWYHGDETPPCTCGLEQALALKEGAE